MKTLPNPINYYIWGPGVRLETPKFYSYVLAKQGLIKWAQNAHVEASALIAPAYVAGLAEWPCLINLNVRRIPVTWLQSVLQHAIQAGSQDERVTYLPIEQMYHFYWLDQGWRVSIPKQNASPGRVAYRGGDDPSIVLDLHSHHQMAAYFSPTDNRDEQGLRFYAVIGRIYDRPEIRLRLGIYGDFVDLPVTTLFEGAGPFIDCYGDHE